MKKYVVLIALLSLILLMPPAQATLTEMANESDSIGIYASVVIGEGVEVDIKPDTLSSSSKCEWITCYITPPGEYTVHDIVLSSIYLEGVPALIEFSGIVDRNSDGICEVMVKFDRSVLIETLIDSDGQVLLTITGLFSDGVSFTGSDTVNLVFH